MFELWIVPVPQCGMPHVTLRMLTLFESHQYKEIWLQ